MKSRIFKELIA